MNLIKEVNIKSFSRLIWKTAESKNTWESCISRISSFVSELEILSVVEDHRKAAWQTISEDEMTTFSERMNKQGLYAVPIARVAKFEGFAHRHEAPSKDKISNICVIVAKTLSIVEEFRHAYHAKDSVIQGRLLGYPECCSHFFQKVWAQGFIDPIWQMAENSKRVEKLDGNSVKVFASPYSNPLLRYIGVRAGFHIPCAFDCEESVKVNKQRLELGHKIDSQLCSKLEKLLRLPMRWDVLNGIGQVSTPYFYIVFQSVPVTEKYSVEVVSCD